VTAKRRPPVSKGDPITILIADDDEEDRVLTEEALADARLANDLRFVVDGQDLIDYLRHEGNYAGGKGAPRPGIILLDLNMPKLDGREALGLIKSDPALKQIPVVVLTTSSADADVVRSYELGVNSFIVKPVTFAGLVEVMHGFSRYWFEIVELPSSPERDGDGLP
jgi:CheY-like chemotaxis protein